MKEKVYKNAWKSCCLKSFWISVFQKLFRKPFKNILSMTQEIVREDVQKIIELSKVCNKVTLR